MTACTYALMNSFFRLHAVKLFCLLMLANGVLLAFLSNGDIKPVSSWAWMDIAGEGGTALLSLLWLGLVLKSRPAGWVTTLLAAGLGCLFFSWWVDCLDEFIQLPEAIHWDRFLESAPMPVGMVLLTLGIYHWHREQLAISAQMKNREATYRDYRLFDRVTPLGAADSLKHHLDQALRDAHRQHKPLCVILVDLNRFHRINKHYGFAEGDKVLNALTQLLLLNLRHHDLLFRLAGDRFVLLLPDTNADFAVRMSENLQQAIAHFSYHHSVNGERIALEATAISMLARDEASTTLMERLNLALARARQPAYLHSA